LGEKFGKHDAARRAGSEHRIEGQAEAAERLQIGGDGAVGSGPVRLDGSNVRGEALRDGFLLMINDSLTLQVTHQAVAASPAKSLCNCGNCQR